MRAVVCSIKQQHVLLLLGSWALKKSCARAADQLPQVREWRRLRGEGAGGQHRGGWAQDAEHCQWHRLSAVLCGRRWGCGGAGRATRCSVCKVSRAGLSDVAMAWRARLAALPGCCWGPGSSVSWCVQAVHAYNRCCRDAMLSCKHSLGRLRGTASSILDGCRALRGIT